jgi:hypothetical protein
MDASFPSPPDPPAVTETMLAPDPAERRCIWCGARDDVVSRQDDGLLWHAECWHHLQDLAARAFRGV